MPTLISRAAVACSAAAIVCLAPAAWAHGKPAGHHPHPAKSGHAAAHAVSAQLARVGRLAAAAGTSRVLNDADRAALTVALVADVAAIRNDAAAVPGADHARRRAIVRAAVNTARVAHEQFDGVVAAGRVRSRAHALGTAVSSLATQVAAAADAGSDTTAAAADAMLADARARLALAGQRAQDAATAELALAPTASRNDQRAGRSAARAALHAARRSESAAVGDVARVSMLVGG